MGGPILVPFGTSPLAERALETAEALARVCGETLLLVRALGEEPTTGTGTTGGAAPTAAGGATPAALGAPEGVVERLGVVARRLRGRGVPAQAIVAGGALPDAVAAVARRHGAGLVVIASRGAGVLGRPGAADLLVARLTLPVLIVRSWHAEAGRRLTEGVVLVPLDGSPCSERALPTARHLAAAFGGELVLVRAVPPSPIWALPGARSGGWSLAAARAEAEASLATIAAGCAARGTRVRIAVVPGLAAEVLARAIGDHRPALIVMATHGASADASRPLGAVARAVCWDGLAPLLLVRALDPPPAAEQTTPWPCDFAPANARAVPTDPLEWAEPPVPA